jgi:hypothetical protein
MLITLDLLKEKSACHSGQKYFTDHFPVDLFPEGAEYQDVLDQLAKDDEGGYADWLLRNIGKTDAVMEVDGDLEVEGNIFFAGVIKVAGFIEAGSGIKAGWGIEAGSGIKAGWGIEAGSGIKAGSGIEAGLDFGIYAGLRVRVSLKAQYAVVIAKEMPKNLLLGIFKPKE